MTHRLAALAAILFAAALVTHAGPGLAQSQTDECSAPPSAMALGAPLNHTGERLIEGLPVKIVAIGSSSTAGAGASDSAHAYPSQLAAALERRFPRAAVTVLNKGVNG
ncbi:MAG TPA: SGNH/GDSL hydrolase family protein, partial [Alphaproteobacteria bacterium]|nr:SGNH/GDSL hydrolase family protein [Alphaproteobacteria bacterium]